MSSSMKQETIIETARAVPAVVGATAATVTLNDVVAIVTIIYVLLQGAYLIYKWRRDIKEHRAAK